MLRYLRYLFLGLVAVALVTVALANRAPVVLRLLPEDMAALTGVSWAVELPLFAAVFLGVVAGLLIGFVWEWLREARHRAAASARGREADRLARELAMMRDAKGEVDDDVLAILDRRPGR